jgi:hypothetical protein
VILRFARRKSLQAQVAYHLISSAFRNVSSGCNPRHWASGLTSPLSLPAPNAASQHSAIADIGKCRRLRFTERKRIRAFRTTHWRQNRRRCQLASNLRSAPHLSDDVDGRCLVSPAQSSNSEYGKHNRRENDSSRKAPADVRSFSPAWPTCFSKHLLR